MGRSDERSRLHCAYRLATSGCLAAGERERERERGSSSDAAAAAGFSRVRDYGG